MRSPACSSWVKVPPPRVRRLVTPVTSSPWQSACCVDARGSDPVAENDSHGEFCYAVAEVWRHTQTSLARAPIGATVAPCRHLHGGTDRVNVDRTNSRVSVPRAGLMPARSATRVITTSQHVRMGDNFWTLRGYKDAGSSRARSAQPRAAHWERCATSSRVKWLRQSLGPPYARHRFIPGAADRGDFDPTSTTIALIRPRRKTCCQRATHRTLRALLARV